MHDTAYEHGRLFFELYGSDALRTVVELGSQDVNGSLRDHCPLGVHYIGIDVMPAKGVDVVVDPCAPLPLASDAVDAIVTSSAFEHDVWFWDTFLELTRILRPGGLLYINAPANGDFHRFPLDCWRFYPDAGVALERWAARRGVQMELIESFIGLPRAERWADFVAVFRKADGTPPTSRGRICEHAPAINIHHLGLSVDAPLSAETQSMPDETISADLRNELAAAKQSNTTLCADLAAAQRANATLSASLATTSGDLVAARQHSDALFADLTATQEKAAAQRHRAELLETALSGAQQDLAAIRNSTSWRLTAGLRWVIILLRGP